MIYDRLLQIYTPDAAGSPAARRLTLRSAHYAGEMTVYHRTYYAAKAAGETVERMYELPRDDGITATMYAVPEDGHVYRITEAQPTVDRDGLPVTVLSLHREEGRYDLFGA